jgi:hypothetical protein
MTDSRDHPNSYTMDIVSSFIRDKEAETNYLTPSCSEVKNGGAIPPLPLRLHGLVLN